MNKTTLRNLILAITMLFAAELKAKSLTYATANNDIKLTHLTTEDPIKMLNKPSDNKRRFLSLERDKELLEIEAKLRERHLLYDPNVKWLMEKAVFASSKSRIWAMGKLQEILEAETIEDMQTGNVWGPLSPAECISNGELLLYNQTNGVPWRIMFDAITRGVLLTGSQGGGKSRLLIKIAKQLDSAGIPFFILDPKQGFKDWANYLNAIYIDVEDISIDLSPPPGLTYEQFLPSLMPQLGDIIGVIYGTEILQEAAQICINLRNEYIQRTGKNTEISLFDIYEAIPSVKGSSKGRRLGYRDALLTAIGRILSGSGNLFKCRKGIDFTILFQSNVILGCRNITDDYAAKFLAFFILFKQYESERFSPPSNKLKSVLILDDASQYLANKIGFDSITTTSSFTNIFTRLRSSGRGVIPTTQIPHLADSGIVALCHTIINVGPLHFGKDTKLLAEMMGLNEDQRLAISKLGHREVIGVSSGGSWPEVIHGYTCDVPDIGGVK